MPTLLSYKGAGMRKLFCLLASCALVASCGEGGGSTSAGGTTTPTPSPAPTPTPTGALLTGEVKPAADATFIAASMDLTTTGDIAQTNGIITGGTTSDRVTTFDTPSFSGSYNAATGYTLSDAVNAAVFGRAQLALDSTVRNGNGVVLFTRLGTVEDYLALYQQTTYSSSVGGSGYTTAQYGGTAGWQHTVVGASRRTRLDYFAYGTPTPIGAMPRSGRVRYSMLGSGNYATDTDLWFLTSQNGNTITVDFGAGTVSGKLGLAGQNFFKNVVGGIGYIPLDGSFTGNSMSVTFSFGVLESSSAVPGQFHLLFVGPNADEIVVTYVARDGTHAAVGAAVGVIDRNIQ